MVVRLPGFGRALLVSFGMVACLLLGQWSIDTYRASVFLHQAQDLLLLGKYNSALLALERANQLTPGNAAIAREEGKTYYLMYAFRRDPAYAKQALVAYESATALNPLDGLNYNNLGWAHMKVGNEVRAESAFKAALDRDPYNVYYLYSMGRLYEHMGDLEQSVVHYERALSVRPNSRVSARLEHLKVKSP